MQYLRVFFVLIDFQCIVNIFKILTINCFNMISNTVIILLKNKYLIIDENLLIASVITILISNETITYEMFQLLVFVK